jgi:hypothetical protein
MAGPIPVPTDLVVRTYDPKQIYVAINGIPMTGYADGTFINITSPEDFWEKKRGADGTIDRTAKNIFDVEITLTLKGTSISNNVLSELHGLDQTFGTGKFNILVENTYQGIPILFAESAWVRKYPDTEFSDTSTNKEWMIDTGIAQYTPGGAIL